jgi:hypothetical protein
MGDEAAAAEATSARSTSSTMRQAQEAAGGAAILAQQALDADMDAAVAKGIAPHRFADEMLRRSRSGASGSRTRRTRACSTSSSATAATCSAAPKDKTGLIDVVASCTARRPATPPPRRAGEGVGDTFERLRLRFNRAGGDIGKRADFGLPHRHDPLKVREAGFEEFRADLLRELAPEKMIDPLTGGAFTPERLDEFIEAARKNIAHQRPERDWRQRRARLAHALANRRSDPRFFVFKDGDAWLRIAAKYGDGNPFEAIMSHVHGMARDIAFMERLRAQPGGELARGIDRADRIAANSASVHTGAINGTSAAKHHAERMWRYMNGDLTVPVLPEGDGILRASGAARSTRSTAPATC